MSLTLYQIKVYFRELDSYTKLIKEQSKSHLRLNMVEWPLLPFQKKNQQPELTYTRDGELSRSPHHQRSYCCACSPWKAAPRHLRTCPWPLAQPVLQIQGHVPEYFIRCWHIIQWKLLLQWFILAVFERQSFLITHQKIAFKWPATVNHGEPFQWYLHCLESYNPFTNQHLHFSDLSSKTSLLFLWWWCFTVVRNDRSANSEMHHVPCAVLVQ